MKKIMFFNRSFFGGGVEKVLIDIIRNLDKTKYDITVITRSNDGPYFEETKKYARCINCYSYLKPGRNFFHKVFNNIIIRLGEWSLYKFPKLYYALAIREKFDIEVAFMHNEAAIIIANSTNKNSKKIAWVHTDLNIHSGWTAYYKNAQYRKNVYKKYDKVVAISNTVKNSVKDVLELSENVEVIYNPINEKLIKQLADSENIDFKEPFILSVGRLSFEKRYDFLIKTYHKALQDYNIKEKLYIIGDGPEREKLEKLINDFNLQENVFLLGYKSNPYPFVKNSKFTVCSSLYEGLHIASIESISLGVPVLSRVKVVEEIFGEHKCGIICENDNDFYDAFIKMNSDILSYKSEAIKQSKNINLEDNINKIKRLFDNI